MRSFVCLYYGRTGSSWLVNSLASVPRVLIPAFEPVETWSWDGTDDAKLAWLEAALHPPDPSDAMALAAWSDQLAASPQFEQLHKANFDVVGFKMSLGAVSDQDRLLGLLSAAGPRLLFLERRNRLKHALSLYRAHEESKDQFTKEGEQPATRVWLRTFDRWVRHSHDVHAAHADFRRRAEAEVGATHVLGVAYEDFVDDVGKERVIADVARFLGLDPAKVRPSPYRKVTPDDLAAAILNYAAVRRRYEGGPLERFLDD